MFTIIKSALMGIAKKVIIAAVSEAVLKKAVIALLEEGAKRTDWDLDDEIVAEIKKAL